MHIEPMTAADWLAVATIYAEGIAERTATFETEVPSWEHWDAHHLATCRFVARESTDVLGWVALSAVSRRHCYRGVAELSVYVRASAQRRGVGRALLTRLIAESEAEGIWTLQGATFPENAASIALHTACGFRVVGRRERVAQLDGIWRDTVLLERRSMNIGAQGA